mmetsp:Transcript_16828/g.14756  ORF Transcript_16828/g.14756 Transcript_16828/m.14756 type:complete len:222 (-) Transcript_16828:64-729(-)
MSKIGKNYGPFGIEKVKILDHSFDMFLENILSGPGIKQEFYSIDRDLPKNFTEIQSFMKMKKYQQYESIPDEYVREYLLAKQVCLNEKNEFNNEFKNKVVMIQSIKDEMKEGVNKLLQGKEEIYKSLRKYDVLHLMYEGRTFNKEIAINHINEMKQCATTLTYKDVFGIKTEEVDVTEEVLLPEPKVYKKLRVHTYGIDPKASHPSVLKGTWKVNRLVLAN